MTSPQATPLPAISLEQWTALNEEIAALVRAGVPLERGLADLASDLPGRLGRFTAALAERMEQGQALAEALAQEEGRLPPLYRAVVLAGLRSGKLSLALEGLAATSRRLADARRTVASAFLYPLVVALLAWALFVFMVTKVLPGVAAVVSDYHAPAGGLLTWLAGWAPSARWWAPVPPVAVVVLGALAWWLSGRPGALGSQRPAKGSAGIPWLGRMVRALRVASFADVLAVLVESRVPLDEGLELAGQACGDPRLNEAAGQMAAAIRRGERLGIPARGATIPPLLAWLMGAGQTQGSLVPALRQAADTYRGRAVRQAELLRVVLPVLLTVLVGGTVTFVFGLLVFGPWIGLLHQLAGV